MKQKITEILFFFLQQQQQQIFLCEERTNPSHSKKKMKTRISRINSRASHTHTLSPTTNKNSSFIFFISYNFVYF